MAGLKCRSPCRLASLTHAPAPLRPALRQPADRITAGSAAAERPNVLFIAIDDLNDWVGCLGGHPQASTPHLDALARRGVLFDNARCQAPICQPSRTSLLTGTYPFHNGVYDIPQRYQDAPALKGTVTLPLHFRRHGYHTVVAGKVFHHPPDPADWFEHGPNRGAWPKLPFRDRATVSGLPLAVSWNFDFGPVDFPSRELPDGRIATWAVAPGDDLEDLPPMGRKFTRYFDHSPMSHNEIVRRGLWRKAVAACPPRVDHSRGTEPAFRAPAPRA